MLLGLFLALIAAKGSSYRIMGSLENGKQTQKAQKHVCRTTGDKKNIFSTVLVSKYILNSEIIALQIILAVIFVPRWRFYLAPVISKQSKEDRHLAVRAFYRAFLRPFLDL